MFSFLSVFSHFSDEMYSLELGEAWEKKNFSTDKRQMEDMWAEGSGGLF